MSCLPNEDQEGNLSNVDVESEDELTSENNLEEEVNLEDFFMKETGHLQMLAHRLLLYYSPLKLKLNTYQGNMYFISKIVGLEELQLEPQGIPSPQKAFAQLSCLLAAVTPLHNTAKLDERLYPVLEQRPSHSLKIPECLLHQQHHTSSAGETVTLHVYSISISLVPDSDEFKECFGRCYSDHRIQCYGLLTHLPLPPHLPMFDIFPRYGTATVQVRYEGTIEVDLKRMPLYRWFQEALFTHVLSLENITYRHDIIIKDYLILPLCKVIEQDQRCCYRIANPFLLELYHKWDTNKRNWKYETLSGGDISEPLDMILVQTYRFGSQTNTEECPSYEVMSNSQAVFIATGVSDETPDSYLRPRESEQGVTFREYFREKYSLEVSNPGAPLIRVRHISKKYNMLWKRSDAIRTDFLILEFCGVHPFPASLFNQATCLVTILWRVETFALTHELFARIPPLRDRQVPTASDPARLHLNQYFVEEGQLRDRLRRDEEYTGSICWMDLLQCITTKGCQESFDLERLEFLGDSFLKYVTSLFLFQAMPGHSEGDLTAIKSRVVGNKNLAVQATRYLDLPRYVMTKVFYPKKQWFPPYHLPTDFRDTSIPSDDGTIATGIKFQWEEYCKDIPTDYKHPYQVKDIADACEALIGLCFSKYGFRVAVEFLDYIDLMGNVKTYLLVDFLYTPCSYKGNNSRLIPETLAQLEEKLGYSFRNPALLLEAVTHSSAHVEGTSYQRLEFLGDALLDILVVCHIYPLHTDFQPGQLSDLKSFLVRNTTLGRICLQLGIHTHIIHSSESVKKKTAAATRGFVSEMQSKEDIDQTIDKMFGDVVESVIGAMYLDMEEDFDRVWTVIFPWFQEYYDMFAMQMTAEEEEEEGPCASN